MKGYYLTKQLGFISSQNKVKHYYFDSYIKIYI